MKQLPRTGDPVVLRTDFTNPSEWDDICSIIRRPTGEFGFLANVTFIDNQSFAGIDKTQLMHLVSHNYPHSIIIVADSITFSHSDHPLQIIDLWREPGKEFRSLPEQIQDIENNLSIANMDFVEFASEVDETGIFRGFPDE